MRAGPLRSWELPGPRAGPLFTASLEPAESRVSVRTSLTEERYEEFEKARVIISRKVPGASVEDVLNELLHH